MLPTTVSLTFEFGIPDWTDLSDDDRREDPTATVALNTTLKSNEAMTTIQDEDR